MRVKFNDSVKWLEQTPLNSKVNGQAKINWYVNVNYELRLDLQLSFLLVCLHA